MLLMWSSNRKKYLNRNPLFSLECRQRHQVHNNANVQILQYFCQWDTGSVTSMLDTDLMHLKEHFWENHFRKQKAWMGSQFTFSAGSKKSIKHQTQEATSTCSLKLRTRAKSAQHAEHSINKQRLKKLISSQMRECHRFLFFYTTLD